MTTKAEEREMILSNGPEILEQAGIDWRANAGDPEAQERMLPTLEDDCKQIIDAIDALDREHGPESSRLRLRRQAEDLLAGLHGGAEIVALIQRPRRNLTDLGNAERFADDHSDSARVIPGRRPTWFLWTGRRWRQDETATVSRLAKETARSIRVEAQLITGDTPDKKALSEQVFKWAVSSEARTKLEAIPALASSDERLVIRSDGLDADPMLMTVENGTLDLRTCELREHRRADLITKAAPVSFDAGAECPTWLRCVEEWTEGDEERAAFLQRAVGYSLTGDTSEQCIFVLDGPGANGKSTFLEAIGYVVGDYGMSAASSTFMTRPGRSVRSDVARLRGTRLVRSSEVEEDARFAESLVKTMTGGEMLVAANLYKDEIEFRPRFKVWLSVNSLPEIRGTDHAIWRRIRRVRFARKIERPDKQLPAKLRGEAPGILAWAIEGCRRWQADGLGVPEAIREATQSYRHDQDSLGRFLEEQTTSVEGATTVPTDLREAYVAWCQIQEVEPLSQQAYVASLEKRGVTRHRTKAGRFWVGIALRGAE